MPKPKELLGIAQQVGVRDEFLDFLKENGYDLQGYV